MEARSVGLVHRLQSSTALSVDNYRRECFDQCGFWFERRQPSEEDTEDDIQTTQGTPQNTQETAQTTQEQPQNTQETAQTTQGTPQTTQETPQTTERTPQQVTPTSTNKRGTPETRQNLTGRRLASLLNDKAMIPREDERAERARARKERLLLQN